MGSRRTWPWPGVAAARLFLGGLADGRWDGPALALLRTLDCPALAGWLIRQDLAPLTYDRGQSAFPELMPLLRTSVLSALARNSLHAECLSRVLEAFRAASIPVVLLKGMALAKGAYGGVGLRPMGDVDLWLRKDDVLRAADVMRGIGFRVHAKDDRPPDLQTLSLGEVQLFSPAWRGGLIELHWSPFPGWWLRRTAAVDHGGIWERAEPLPLDDLEFDDPAPVGGEQTGLVRQLAVEDAVIQVAVHLAVGNQFGLATVRGLMDVALMARARKADWASVAGLARRWRVATAVWAVLDLAEQLVGLPGVDAALARLRPSTVRRALLRPLISPESVLEERSLLDSRLRYLVLLLLIDRARDGVHLVSRALWPEGTWMTARYGPQWSRRRHLWRVVRRGRF